MSLRIDLDKTLEFAEGLFIQLSTFKNLPVAICEILGLPFQKSDTDIAKDELDLNEDSLAKKKLNS